MRARRSSLNDLRGSHQTVWHLQTALFMGAGASTLGAGAITAEDGPQNLLQRLSHADGVDYCSPEVDTSIIASRLFEELDAGHHGQLLADDLVPLACEYFSSLPTVQPQHWIRTQILKHSRDGILNEEDFFNAVVALRSC